MSCNCTEYTDPCETCSNPCEEGDTTCSCAVKDLSTDCSVYTGDDLECSGIEKNTVLSQVIQQLDAFICNIRTEIISYLTLINIGTGAQVYKGISGIGNKEIRTIKPKGTPNNIPSTLSIIPPWPGRKFPVSLIFDFLLRKEKNKSPAWQAMEVKKPIIKKSIVKILE